MPGNQYWDPQPAASSRPRDTFLRLREGELALTIDSGVFSREHVDPGTLVLLRAAPPPPPTGNILDLGTGYGPVAIALALRAPGATIWGVDVNQRALNLLRQNARVCGATNIIAAAPEDVPDELRFAALYANPPVKIGKNALHELLLRWLERLLPTAHAYLEVKKNLGADALGEWLTEQGYPTVRLCSKRGYRVLDVART